VERGIVRHDFDGSPAADRFEQVIGKRALWISRLCSTFESIAQSHRWAEVVRAEDVGTIMAQGLPEVP
jgi:hypothetical protein